jgi:integrase
VPANKLYHLTDSGFSLPFYINEQGTPVTTEAANIPTLVWPNGAWCFPANVYMLELYRRGLSRKYRGSSLLTYGTNISHLIRFCFKNVVDFIDLTDSLFSLFIKTLAAERHGRYPEKLARDANSVIAIGRNCLDFLMSVGRLYNDDTLIGISGRIVIEEREVTIHRRGRPKGKDTFTRKFVHHHSFPTPDPMRKRLPIPTENIEKLYDAVEPASSSIYQRKRRYAMIKLLEITGGRRSEIAALTVDSVRKAALMDEPKLKLRTAKRRGGRDDYRYLPVCRHDVVFLLEFIDKNRRRIVRAKCGVENDDGYVLVSQTTGRKLCPNTITQETGILAKQAGIGEKVCPHMFRHGFLTNVFVALIENHRLENADHFRQALLDTESLRQEVLEWAGQTDPASIEPYIHLGFAKLAKAGQAKDAVALARMVNSLKSSIHVVQSEMRGGLGPDEAIRQLLALSEALERDLVRANEDMPPKEQIAPDRPAAS